MAGGADKQHGSHSGRQAYFNFRTGTGPCGHIITGHQSLLGLLSRRAQLSLMWLQGAPISCMPQHPEASSLAHGTFFPLELAAVSQDPPFSPSCLPEDLMMRRVQTIQDPIWRIPSVTGGHVFTGLTWAPLVEKSHLRAPPSHPK